MEKLITETKFLYRHALYSMEYEKLLNKRINDYYDTIGCTHEIFIDQGYYRLNNGDFFRTNRDEALFRLVKCVECNQNIFLFKNKSENWDTTFKNKQIFVNNPVKIKVKAK